MNNGYISLHRRMADKAWYKNPNYLAVWIYLLLFANHKPKEFMWNGSIVTIKRGQLLTGRKEISINTGVASTSVERALNIFQNGQQIGQQKTTKYRIITILNYDKYQKADSKTDSKRTTDGQQTDTNNNDNNDNKDNKNTIIPERSSNIVEIIKIFESLNPTINYGNTTTRSSCKRLLDKFGLEAAVRLAEYAISVQGQKYAPTITTPYQLEQKLGELRVFNKKESNNKIQSL